MKPKWRLLGGAWLVRLTEGFGTRRLKNGRGEWKRKKLCPPAKGDCLIYKFFHQAKTLRIPRCFRRSLETAQPRKWVPRQGEQEGTRSKNCFSMWVVGRRFLVGGRDYEICPPNLLPWVTGTGSETKAGLAPRVIAQTKKLTLRIPPDKGGPGPSKKPHQKKKLNPVNQGGMKKKMGGPWGKKQSFKNG